jgi:maltose alpha-D-glucosyltransferase/alpha-amylase
VAGSVSGYQVVNVRAQSRLDHSLFSWLRRLIRVRKSSRVFGRGSLEFLQPRNYRVLAYLRRLGDEIVLVVNNLSGSAQAVELDLAAHAGAVPIEMLGGNLFPRIGKLPYLLTLGPYQFFWFRLRRI